MELEKKCEFANLFNFYKNLLTPKRQNICEKFYNQDIQMVEIAVLENVSRQAVKDCVTKCEKMLLMYEEKLHLYEIYSKQQKTINKLMEDNPNLSSKLEKVMKIWDN